MDNIVGYRDYIVGATARVTDCSSRGSHSSSRRKNN